MRSTLCIATALFLTHAVSLPAHADFRAGAAIRTVTPDPLLPVSGGTGGTKPTTKKFGELTVRAMVLDKDGTRVAIASADFLGFPGVLGDRVRAQVKDIPKENIIIGATHAHSAPDMYGFVNEDGKTGADLKYIDSVCVKMAEAINEAVQKLQPADLKINTADAKGKIAYNYYAPELYDHRMNVVQCIATAGPDKGKPIVTLVNYATHPEIIGSDQGIISPDLCGPLYDRIQEKGGGIGIFMNSAQGGMVTADCRGPNGDVQTWEECIRIGDLMADEALRIIADAPVQAAPDMACWATTIKFPVDTPLMQAILASSPLGFKMTEDKKAPAQVNVVNLGNAQILTIPGEALPNVGFYLKRKMHGKFNFLFGLTNDAYGYMLAKVDWDSFKRYEYISKTTLGEMTAEILMDEGIKFVDSLPRPQGQQQ